MNIIDFKKRKLTATEKKEKASHQQSNSSSLGKETDVRKVGIRATAA